MDMMVILIICRQLLRLDGGDTDKDLDSNKDDDDDDGGDDGGGDGDGDLGV